MPGVLRTDLRWGVWDPMGPATMRMDVGGTVFTVALEDNGAARALAGMLPIAETMEELNGNEKYLYLDEPLPVSPYSPGTVRAGDVMLWGDDCLVVFYKTFSTGYPYTPIGRVTDAAGLAEALGPGDVAVSFSV